MPTCAHTQLYDTARELLAAALAVRANARRTDHGPAVPATLACLDETLSVLSEASAALAEEMRRARMLSDRPASACMVALDGLTEALDAARGTCGVAHATAALATSAPTVPAL